MLKELKSRSLSGKTKSLITLLLMCCCTFSQWVQTTSTPEGSGITGMIITSPGHLVVTTGSVSGGQQGGIRVSDNGGQTWINPVNCFIARTIVIGSSGAIYASVWNYPSSNEGIYVSYDNISWYGVYNFPTTGNNIFSIVTTNNDTNIFAGTRTGVLRSTNYGASFSYSNNGMTPFSWVLDLAVDSNNIIAAATSNGLFISTNLGNSWQQCTGLSSNDTVTDIEFIKFPSDNIGDNSDNDSKLAAGTDDGKFFFSEESNLYTALVLAYALDPNFRIESIGFIKDIFSMMIVVAGRPKYVNYNGNRIFVSNDGAVSFVPADQGLPPNSNCAKILGRGSPNRNNSNALFYCGLFQNSDNGAQVFSRTFPIGIQQTSTEIPEGYSLLQNYPNPFNPTTVIRFQLTVNSFAKLVIYDILGRETAILVNEYLKAGTYEVDWDASNLPGGIYFYKLETESFTETRKAILIK